MNFPKGVFVYDLPEAEQLNKKIVSDFQAYEHDETIRRSHLIDGRFENIYLDTDKVPAMKSILEQGCLLAKQFLNLEESVRAGFWFNAMQPGHATGAHTHDDDDECLSAVYYIMATKKSGDLMLHTLEGTVSLEPKPGRFVFFPPDMLHEVTENQGTGLRLSAGINFGPTRKHDE